MGGVAVDGTLQGPYGRVFGVCGGGDVVDTEVGERGWVDGTRNLLSVRGRKDRQVGPRPRGGIFSQRSWLPSLGEMTRTKDSHT